MALMPGHTGADTVQLLPGGVCASVRPAQRRDVAHRQILNTQIVFCMHLGSILAAHKGATIPFGRARTTRLRHLNAMPMSCHAWHACWAGLRIAGNHIRSHSRHGFQGRDQGHTHTAWCFAVEQSAPSARVKVAFAALDVLRTFPRHNLGACW